MSTEWGSQGRLEHGRIRLTRVEPVRVAAEDLLGERRIRHVHKPRERWEIDAENVAVAAPQSDQEADRIAPQAKRVDRPRQSRTRREVGRSLHPPGT
jgi:hypothetical protein